MAARPGLLFLALLSGAAGDGRLDARRPPADADVWCAPAAVRAHGGVSQFGGCVHQVAAALPAATAKELHGLLHGAWSARQFQYATNCKEPAARDARRPCRGACSNTKHRYDFGAAARERPFSSLCKGSFSYSKYELARDHPAHGAIAGHLASGPVRRAIEDAVGVELEDLTDWFASAFSGGDWLSNHVDGGLGHVAFVLNLTPDWDPAGGGALAFAAGNHSVAPAFNSLAAFRVGTGVIQLLHHVTEVAARPQGGDGVLHRPRLAITGWWTIKGGRADAVDQATLAAERGAH